MLKVLTHSALGMTGPTARKKGMTARDLKTCPHNGERSRDSGGKRPHVGAFGSACNRRSTQQAKKCGPWVHPRLEAIMRLFLVLLDGSFDELPSRRCLCSREPKTALPNLGASEEEPG